MREKAEQGHYPSFAPLGYQNNRETKRIEIDPEVAALIKKLFEWYATGNYSLLQVRNMARELMETQRLAFQYARRLTKSTVEHILKNPIYCGDFLWNGKLYHGSHPPIVSHALWEQTQEAFRKTNHPKQTKHEFPFIGMLTCAFCGCAITAEIKKSKYIYYHCTGNHGPCPKPIARQETLGERLGEVIKGITIDDSLLDWLVQALRESHRDEKAHHDGMISGLQIHYDRLQHRIDQAYTDKLDGKIPEDLCLRKMNEWREEQSKILSQTQAHQTANHNYLEEGIRILELANKAYSLYLRQPAHEKARLLKIVQSNCTWDGVSPSPAYRKPFDILAEGLSTREWLPVLYDLQTIPVSFAVVA
jgi:hypothetical protein